MKADLLLDERMMQAPVLPPHRPPTKAEYWARYSFVYEGIWSVEKIKLFCKVNWAWAYVYAFNFRAWRKHPDWSEGQPVIHEAVPSDVFEAGSKYVEEVERLWNIARSALNVR